MACVFCAYGLSHILSNLVLALGEKNYEDQNEYPLMPYFSCEGSILLKSSDIFPFQIPRKLVAVIPYHHILSYPPFLGTSKTNSIE